uniref:Uncharacterized protein n=1 Tax=Glossina palpalis gambiensis TaxID=67801 RepID=A0A1B0C207_9MUSC
MYKCVHQHYPIVSYYKAQNHPLCMTLYGECAIHLYELCLIKVAKANRRLLQFITNLDSMHGINMYENSCSYQTALDLKRVSPPALTQVKTEDCLTLGQCSPDWTSYRFHQSTFEQLKQSVEKAKAALQDRSTFFGASSAFSDIYSTPRLSDTLDTLPNVQGNNGANCIGIVHNSNSSSVGASTPSLVLNGNCITTVSSVTSGQRYRLDSLQPAGCSPVTQHGVITSSAAPPPPSSSLATTTLDGSPHLDTKTRVKGINR